MTRKLILIRHAMPDLPLGERWCVGGRTDLPLGRLGRLQAALLPFAEELKEIRTVYCSRLLRSRETALALCGSPRELDGIEEQDMGEWDGLSFREIQSRFPALYAAREKDPTLLPAGAESEERVRERVCAALRRALRQSPGDLAVVSHKGAIAALTGSREGLDYTSLTVLKADGETFSVRGTSRRPHPALDDAVCEALLDAAGADEALKAHCRAVAELAYELGAALEARGCPINVPLLRSAALLHDLARGESGHAALGARWLRELGYPDVSELVRQHHDLDAVSLDEAGLLYLADKAVRGRERVSIEARFAVSGEKCTTLEARAAHDRRLAAARALRDALNARCGAELIR